MEWKPLIIKALATAAILEGLYLGFKQESNIGKYYSDKPKKYAVLLSGTIETRDEVDITLIRDILLDNEFDDKKIYLFDGDGVQKELYPVYRKSTKTNILRLFSALEKKTNDNDVIYVHITDHGERIAKESVICLSGFDRENAETFLSETELKQALDKIKSRKTIVVADICYGGGFARRFSTGKYVGISSAEENQLTYRNVREGFGRYFMQALIYKKAADVNKDGKISTKEAFEYAKSMDRNMINYYQMTPLIKSELNLDEEMFY